MQFHLIMINLQNSCQNRFFHDCGKIDFPPTSVPVFNESPIDVLLLLFGVFQDVEETQVDSVRLFHDDVQQRLSGFDWTISQRLN